MKKKILSAVMALLLVCSPFVIPIANADTESDYKQQLSELAEKEKEYQSQLNEAKADIEDKEAYSETLMNQVDTLNQEISAYTNEISALNDSISEKQADIDKANRDIKGQMNTLKKRIRAIYMAGETSDLEIILGAKDFSDFLDKVELVKTLSEYDKKLIGKIQKRLDKVSGEKEELESEKSELEEAENQLFSKQNKLNNLLAENEEVLAELYSAKSDVESLLAQAEAEEAEVQSQLDAYYESLRQQESGSTDDGGSDGGSYVVPSGSGYTWPVPGHYSVFSPFGDDRGYSHKGIDISEGGIMGATVVAPDSGVVIASNNSCPHNWGKSGSCGCGGGYGNYVMIDHGGGRTTICAHLTSAVVSSGQSVSRGEVIGYVGSTGWSEGAHLHFETRLNGYAYNPMTEF